MSKLIIIGVENGKVKYLAGEEETISVEEIHTRLAEINGILNQGSSYEENIEKAKAWAQKELENKKVSLSVEFNQFKAEVEEELEAKLDRIERDQAEDLTYVEELKKEKSKLEKILFNLEPEPEPIKEVKVEAKDVMGIEAVDEVPDGTPVLDGVELTGTDEEVEELLEKVEVEVKEESKAKTKSGWFIPHRKKEEAEPVVVEQMSTVEEVKEAPVEKPVAQPQPIAETEKPKKKKIVF